MPIESKRETSRTVKILMVEDDDYYWRFVDTILSGATLDQNFKVERVADLTSALDLLRRDAPDVILLDLNLSDSRGLATLEKVKVVSGTTPIIILTGSDDEKQGFQSVSIGAQDYLIKQHISGDSLVRSIRYAIERRKSDLAHFRLTAIRDFSAALAHDLQVPLVGSRNLLDAMLTNQMDDDGQREALLALQKSNAEQLFLVQRLLEIYRYESQESELLFMAVCIREIISKCIEKLDFQIKSHQVNIDASLPNDLQMVLGDKRAIEQVFMNLLDNAIKFGTLSNKVEVWASNDAESVIVHFKSIGQVISLEDQSLLFQGFWQGIPGKKYVATTGLGLYLCHHLVTLHKGKITCTSDDHGTTFSVILPKANIEDANC